VRLGVGFGLLVNPLTAGWGRPKEPVEPARDPPLVGVSVRLNIARMVRSVFLTGALAGCTSIGGVIYELQMQFSDAVQLEDGTWSEIDLAMNDVEKACMAKTCGDSKANEATYTTCFKDKCRKKSGSDADRR